MVQIVWSARALSDLAAIRTYVEHENPFAARRLTQRLLAAGDSLGVFPERGRPWRFGARELTTVPPYLIRYVFEGDVVSIATVFHGARRRP